MESAAETMESNTEKSVEITAITKLIDETKRITIPPPPEGMSKSQWKKQWKRKLWDESKDAYAAKRRAKRQKLKQNRRDKIKSYTDKGQEIPQDLVREPRVNRDQVSSGVKIILDCSFDDLMNPKEIISLSNQITRSYGCNNRAAKYAEIEVTGFNKRLKERFENKLVNTRFNEWPHVKFIEDETLPGTQEKTQEDDKNTEGQPEVIYLSADTEDELTEIKPGNTYIIGGIVDKNRHKELCYNKAKDLNLKVRRLPIGKFIKLDGRHVMTTAHVVHILLEYLTHKDWKIAFNNAIPERRIDTVAMDNLQERLDAEDKEEDEP